MNTNTHKTERLLATGVLRPTWATRRRRLVDAPALILIGLALAACGLAAFVFAVLS